MIESVSSKLAITIIKQKVVVSFTKGTSNPKGLIIPVINNDQFLTVIQARIHNSFSKGGSSGVLKLEPLMSLNHSPGNPEPLQYICIFFVVTNR